MEDLARIKDSYVLTPWLPFFLAESGLLCLPRASGGRGRLGRAEAS